MSDAMLEPVPDDISAESLTPDDVLAVARWSYQALEPLAESDWSRPAVGPAWDCQQTLEHLLQAFDRYSLYLANPDSEGAPRIVGHYDGHSIGDLLTFMLRRAGILAAVAAAAPPNVIGFHPSGRSDQDGFIAMACVETIVHTDDIGQAFGQTFEPRAALCRRALMRLFPWAPNDVDAWPALRHVTGRMSLPSHTPTPPNWAYHTPPLATWDGSIRTMG